ncbi:MAG: T9SS type A sorting domain-containing protein [Saprospiraceae bacterium]|nr:T9SS type A sorting domain-containing protein [Saprospiraceae bacterium]
MKKTTFALLLLSCCPWLAAQCPLGDVTFSTQGQIDSFQINYPGCTDIPGNVTIQGSGITNLDSLIGIATIGGDLMIGETLAWFSPKTNLFLKNLSGLDSLHTVGGSLKIFLNAALANLNGLGHLAKLGANLEIVRNDSLASISALGQLDTIPGSIWIGRYVGGGPGGNPQGNNSLVNLEGLGNIQGIGQDLVIMRNSSLVNLSGLENLHSIGGGLSITHTKSMISLNGLENLQTIGGGLHIGGPGSGWTSITSLNGLENLQSIEGSLTFTLNYALTSLSGLDNIDPATITEVIISNNSLLSLCNTQPICEYLENGGTAFISGNAPGCNSVPEIEAACAVPTQEVFAGEISVWPNPATDFLKIALPENAAAEPLAVQLFDVAGRCVRFVNPEKVGIDKSHTLNLTGFPPGVFALKVVAGERVFLGKFVKQ